MRKLRRNKFDEQPERHHPGKQEPAFNMRKQQRQLAGSARQQKACRPHQERGKGEIGSDRRAMRFLAAFHLRQEIPPERLVEKRPVRRQRDHDCPRHRDKQQDDDPAPGTKKLQPAQVAVPGRQRRHRRQRQKRCHRTLDEDGCRHRQPDPKIGVMVQSPAMLPAAVNPHQPELLDEAQQHQHRVRLRQVRLGENDQRAATGRGGEKRAARLVKRSPETIGAIDGQKHGNQARQAIGGDVFFTEKARRCRLQPVDPDRLFRPDLVLKPDGDEIAGIGHLPACLREAGFVAVHRRHCLVADHDGGGEQRQHQQKG